MVKQRVNIIGACTRETLAIAEKKQIVKKKSKKEYGFIEI
jgi:hypothetical protein